MCICTVPGPVGLGVAGNSEETGTLLPRPPPSRLPWASGPILRASLFLWRREKILRPGFASFSSPCNYRTVRVTSNISYTQLRLK